MQPFEFFLTSLPGPLDGASVVRGAAGGMLGAIVGSFIATIFMRWPEGRSVLTGRSGCDGCGKTLGVAELVPILSWVALRGRCRTCGSEIAREHVAIELTAALIGVTAMLAHSGWVGSVTAFFGWWLLLVAALDARHLWLPDRLTLPLIPAGLAVALLGAGPDWRERAIGAVVGYLLLAGIAALYRSLRGREGLGGGDPKLIAGLGAWLGWQQLPYLLLGAGVLGLVAIALKRARGEAVSATDTLPLGALLASVAWPLWLLLAT